MIFMGQTSYPDYYGFWQTGIPSEGFFFLWANNEDGSNEGKNGIIIDRFGIAVFDKGKFTKNRVRFDKLYIPKMSAAGALKKIIRYDGELINQEFRGEYHTLRAHKKSQNYHQGGFVFSKYPLNIPVLDCIVRETCRKTIMDFGSRLGLDLEYVPKKLLPAGRLPALENVIFLGKINR